MIGRHSIPDHLRGKYCVYQHFMDGDLIYIGCGLAHRPFSAESRNSYWRDDTCGNSIDVVIVAWFESKAKAERLEKSMILKLHPSANIVHVPRLHKFSKPAQTGRCKEQVMRKDALDCCSRMAVNGDYCSIHNPDAIAEKGRKAKEALEAKHAKASYMRIQELQTDLIEAERKTTRLKEIINSMVKDNRDVRLVLNNKGKIVRAKEIKQFPTGKHGTKQHEN